MRKLFCCLFILLMTLGIFSFAQASETITFMNVALTDGLSFCYDKSSETLVPADPADAQVTYRNGTLTLCNLDMVIDQTNLKYILKTEGSLTLNLIGSNRIERTAFGPVIISGNLTVMGTGSLSVQANGSSAISCSTLNIQSGTIRAETIGLPLRGAALPVISAADTLTVSGGALYVSGHAPHVAALTCRKNLVLTGGLLSVASDHADGLGITAGNALTDYTGAIYIGQNANVKVIAGETAVQIGTITFENPSAVTAHTAQTLIHLPPIPESTSQPAAVPPASGDSAHPAAWAVLCVGALACMALLRRRKAA